MGFHSFGKSGTHASADNCVLNLHRVIINAVNKLKDHRNEIFAPTKLMESTIQLIKEGQYFMLDSILVQKLLGKLTRKRGYLIKANSILIDALTR